MISEIKNIISSDVMDFTSYWPENEKSFSFLLSIRVGPKGELGEESFDIQVCTPQWLMDKYNENEMILGKNKLIVFKYDRDRIFSRIRRIFDGCDGLTWKEIAVKLSRVGHWEFENYHD